MTVSYGRIEMYVSYVLQGRLYSILILIFSDFLQIFIYYLPIHV